MRSGPRVLGRLRKLCLALPDAHEVMAYGEPTFRVTNRMFATFANADNHHGRGRHAVWIKAAAGRQSDPQRRTTRGIDVSVVGVNRDRAELPPSHRSLRNPIAGWRQTFRTALRRRGRSLRRSFHVRLHCRFTAKDPARLPNAVIVPAIRVAVNVPEK